MTTMNRIDTGAVFKHPVHCFGCHEVFYFTLREIAEAEKLACPQCGSDINLADRAYESLIIWAKDTIAVIDQIQNSSPCRALQGVV
jgi:DNA-directed RNA polymerase subunit RPC12/RpoP